MRQVARRQRVETVLRSYLCAIGYPRVVTYRPKRAIVVFGRYADVYNIILATRVDDRLDEAILQSVDIDTLFYRWHQLLIQAALPLATPIQCILEGGKNGVIFGTKYLQNK
ncbi:hypothetical protein O3G_MSEX015178 [Manduca sexta]|uniref:Uncharacterized protein n=1 Tax=Manduca sexta TaxID=7130 RepID=A0A921ZW81_MANSE|nr:hypothetical protein O3G_MSEX015178 [Manduca sexta]